MARRLSALPVLLLVLLLAACGGGTTDTADGDDDAVTGASAAGEDADGDPAAGDEEPGDDAQPDDGTETDPDDAAEEPADDSDPVAIEGCPLTSEAVSEIVGSDLVAGDPQSTLNEGVTCAYLHETDFDPSAAVTVGNWDGAEATSDDLIATNVDRFGEPTAAPSDLGEHASLWNDEPGGQTTLIVFDAGRYYTTTVTGIGDLEESRDIVVSLFDAAP